MCGRRPVKLGSRKVLRGEAAVAPAFRGTFVGGRETGGVRGPRWIRGAGGIDVGEIKGRAVWGRVKMGWRMAAGNAREVGREMGVRIAVGCVSWNVMRTNWRRSY